MGAGPGRDQDSGCADFFVVRCDPPAVTVAVQAGDLAAAEELRAVASGHLDRGEDRALAADEPALGVEENEVAVPDGVLRQPLPCFVAGRDLEAEPALAPRPEQRRMIGMVMVGDRHHAGDLEELGAAGRLQLPPQVAAALQQGRVVAALGVDHAEHPRLAGVRGERSRHREPVDGHDAQPAGRQLPGCHAPDRARPHDHGIGIHDSHSAPTGPLPH